MSGRFVRPHLVHCRTGPPVHPLFDSIFDFIAFPCSPSSHNPLNDRSCLHIILLSELHVTCDLHVMKAQIRRVGIAACEFPTDITFTVDA